MPGPDDEAAVRDVEEAYDRAWSDGDLDGLMACLSDDAVLVNPRGQVAAGRQEIRAALGGFLGGEANGSAHEATVRRISFIGDDVAVVEGHAVISHRSAEHPLVEHPFTDILVRKGARWSIVHVRAYNFDAPRRVADEEPPVATKPK